MDTSLKDTRSGRVYITLQGGLGNQLFQLCAGLRLLSATKRDVIFLEQFFFNIGSIRRSLAIRDLLQDIKRSKYLSLISTPLIALGTKFKLNFVLNVESDIDFSKMGSNFLILNGWFQSFNLVDGVHCSLIERLKDSDSFSPLVNINRIEAIGVHLRFGDYESSISTRKFHGMTEISYFDDAIEYLRFSLTHIDKIVFVTDDLNRAKIVVGELRSCTEVTPIEIISSTPVNDMAILSSCSGIVLSNSSFSWWAGYFGSSLRTSTVVAPKPWLARDSDFDRSLVAPKWIFINRQVL